MTDVSECSRENAFPRIVEALKAHDRFLLTGHENVDGDSTGSEIALSRVLKSLGKTVRIVNNEAIMSRFEYLDPEGTCEIFDAATFDGILATTDAVVVLDNNSWPRLANLRAPVEASGLPVICIDHHRVETPFCDIHLADTEAAATGQLVYDLAAALDVDIDLTTAKAIYTTLCTDTGWFRFSNTTARVFEICADLVGRGVDPESINAAVNFQDALGLKKLLAHLWTEVRFDHENRFAWICVQPKTLDRFGARMNEAEGFIDQVRSVRGVKLAAFFKVSREGEVRVSLRSRENWSAWEVATAFGGGGHFHASGATMKGMNTSAAVRALREEVDRRIVQWGP